MATTSAAALAFLEHALLADGDGRLTLSQAELARRTGRSPGTVAYYLAHAGPGVVTRRRDGVVVDLDQLRSARTRLARRRRRRDDVEDALITTWGTPRLDGGFELLTSEQRAPTLADIAAQLGVARSTAQRHLSDLAAQGRLWRCGSRLFLDDSPSGRHCPSDRERLQTGPRAQQRPPSAMSANRPPETSPGFDEPLLIEVAQGLLETCGRLARLAEQLLAQADPRAPSRNQREVVAHIAESREGTEHLAEGGFSTTTEKTRKLPYSPANSEPLRAGSRGPAAEVEPEAAPTASVLTDAELDHALASLMAACRDHGLPDVLDRRGRGQLRRINSDGLARAARSIERQVRSGYRMSSPLGILVKAAMEGDHGLFAAPRPTSQRVDPHQRSQFLLGAANLGRTWAAGGADADEVAQWAESAFPEDGEAAAEALDAYAAAAGPSVPGDQQRGQSGTATRNGASAENIHHPVARAI